MGTGHSSPGTNRTETGAMQLMMGTTMIQSGSSASDSAGPWEETSPHPRRAFRPLMGQEQSDFSSETKAAPLSSHGTLTRTALA